MEHFFESNIAKQFVHTKCSLGFVDKRPTESDIDIIETAL